MKKIVALIAALTFVGSVSAMAAGPETITLNAKNGNVTFHHKKHQERLKVTAKPAIEKARARSKDLVRIRPTSSAKVPRREESRSANVDSVTRNSSRFRVTL